jgi:hypothetical protein
LPRVRKVLGHEERVCPVCAMSTWFELYESWTRGSRLSRLRADVRKAAECETCGYKVVVSSISPEKPR